jgi:hypothetical protein
MDVGTPQVRESWTRDERCNALLFMHERKTPAGERRLVTLSFDGPAFLFDQPRPFIAGSYRVNWAGKLGDYSGSRLSCPGFAPPPDRPIRFYAGQPDLIDASRFTIAAKIGEGDALIDGRLNDDDTITLSLRTTPR